VTDFKVGQSVVYIGTSWGKVLKGAIGTVKDQSPNKDCVIVHFPDTFGQLGYQTGIYGPDCINVFKYNVEVLVTEPTPPAPITLKPTPALTDPLAVYILERLTELRTQRKAAQ
jgi:hypothetical protein